MSVRAASLLSVLALSGLPAATLRVPQDFPTIQSAIDNAQSGDEVVVSPGTYTENLVFRGRDITLRSTDPSSPEVVHETIIDGASRGPAIQLAGTETPACAVQGLVIQHGSVPEFGLPGGGIQGRGSHATLEQNWIRENRCFWAPGQGGGLGECHGLIRGNVIEGNTIVSSLSTPSLAHGIAIYNCDGRVLGNLIRGNTRFFGHGYTSFLFGCDGEILGNLVVDNTPSSTFFLGSIYACSGVIAGNTVWSSGGISACRGLVAGNIIGGQSGVPVWASTDPLFCCLPGWQGGGVGNITADPLFVNPLTGDFHLLPTSPCIDAGMRVEGLEVDFDELPRPQRRHDGRGDGSGFDIGAFEYPGGATSELVMNHLLGLCDLDPLLRKACDPNRDGHVDAADAVALEGR